MATIPELDLPASLTDPIIETHIRRETSRVLTLRGIGSLPSAGHERDLIDAAVLDLVTNKLSRQLMPDNPDLLDALRRERERIEDEIRIVKESSADTGLAFGVT